MLKKEILYSLDDVAIEPAKITSIEHRLNDCNPYDENGMLPIFTAPMPCVVNSNMAYKYVSNKINAIIPRNEALISRIMFSIQDSNNITDRYWSAFSLKEFEETFIDCSTQYIKELETHKSCNIHALIDMAVGSMKKLIDIVSKAKSIYGDRLSLMVGNIANPETYFELANAGADYVRCSVGSGSGCCTASFLGTYYPMASLINDCKQIKNAYNFKTKIIADGGINNFRNAYKALALGADYVMCGGWLNTLKDSAGEIEMVNDVEKKVYYGMASEEGQKILGKTNITPPEGKLKYNKISDMNIEDFANKFTFYLRSMMSYCDCKTLNDVNNNINVNVISYHSSKQFNQDDE